jgi:hypothetical protein
VPAKTSKAKRDVIKSRPTLYRGILMRSRLEADFAQFLDLVEADWEYEPVCFAGPSGQWLPDFRVTRPGYHVYFEIKPESTDRDHIDALLQQMTVAWLSEPTATLQLVLWTYHNPRKSLSIGNWTPAPTRPAVVLDPFGGTGTTALVADMLGRTGVTVDRSADYCRIARWRTTDPGERARALGVPKPLPVPVGQGSLFDSLEDGEAS